LLDPEPQRGVDREPIAGEVDHGPERLLEPERARLDQRRDQRPDRRRHRRREQPRAGDVMEAELANPLDRQAARRGTLAADDVRVRAVRSGGAPRLVDQDRALAADPALLRLHQRQRERGRDAGIDRVPATRQHLQPDLRRQVVPGSDDASPGHDRRAGGERRRFVVGHGREPTAHRL
jgi:hypothetical protein